MICICKTINKLYASFDLYKNYTNTNVYTFFLIYKIIQALFKGIVSYHDKKLN